MTLLYWFLTSGMIIPLKVKVVEKTRGRNIEGYKRSLGMSYQ